MQWIAATALNLLPTETPRLRLHIHLLPTKEALNSRHLAEHMKLVCASFFHPLYIPLPQAPIYRALHPCLTPSFVLTLTHQNR
jgi:hypothetical protein